MANQELEIKILEAFGISSKGCSGFTLTARADEALRLTVEYFPDRNAIDDAGNWEPIIKKYKLIQED